MRLKKKLKSFTLVETMATIVIYALLLMMITNIVLLNAKMSERLKIRSRIRSELAETVTLIKRDIRNASSIDSVDNCQGTTCTINLLGNNIEWKFSNNKVTRTNIKTGETYVTSDLIIVDDLAFAIIPDQDALNKRATIVLTIKARGKNPIWKVNNQVIQEAISTRNYELAL